MGSGESTVRKVSFGVDEEDRVRVLRGVKLSEDVLQRMRGVANIPPERTPSPSPSPTNPQRDPGASPCCSPSPRPLQSPPPRAQSSTRTNTSEPAAGAKDDPRRYERQQTILQEVLAEMAQKEREEITNALSGERQHTRQDIEKTKQLAQQLQKKDAELKALDVFYREQWAQLEKRSMERFKQSCEQFQHAASKAEANVRPRSTEPVCPGLQDQILSCYKENREQTLRCSDLAKEYMQCVNAAKKNLLINHG